MAITYTQVPDGNDVWGRNKVKFLDVQYANGTAYPSGGFTLNAAQFELKAFKGAYVVGGDVSQLTYYEAFDFTTSFPGKEPSSIKLRLFTASGTEISGTVGATGYNARIMAVGV